MMKILTFPNPHLFKKCQDVTVFGPELLVLLEAMWETMKRSRGMGLSSNQVGLDYNMFVMLGPKDEKYFVVNPKIIATSMFSAGLKEGCLSAPGELLLVPSRKAWVSIVFQDETGATKSQNFDGIHAVCVQHEMEHLDGKGFMELAQIPRYLKKKLASKWGFKLK